MSDEPTDQEVEKMAERVHHVYCDYHLAVRGVPYWTNGDYSKLEEKVKEADRYMARFFLNVLKRYMPMSEHNNREQSLLVEIKSLRAHLSNAREALRVIKNLVTAASAFDGHRKFIIAQCEKALHPSAAPQGKTELDLLRELERHARLNHMDWNVDYILNALDKLDTLRGGGRGRDARRPSGNFGSPLSEWLDCDSHLP